MREDRALIAALALVTALAHAAPGRSREQRAEFQRANPCPATGSRSGACPGWQVDHRTPLCIGGADDQTNMQWLTIEQHKVKTRSDVRLCRTTP